jgi:hypothetical protein
LEFRIAQRASCTTALRSPPASAAVSAPFSSGVAERWARDTALSDADLIDEVFLRTLTRFPTPEEKGALTAALAGGDRKAVVQDALWAILNSKEFLYNH